MKNIFLKRIFVVLMLLIILPLVLVACLPQGEIQPIAVTLTVEAITAIAAAVLSLIFSYVPPVAKWYNGLVSDTQRIVMLGALLLTVGVIFGLSCAGLVSGVECTQAGLYEMIKLFALAAVANQTTNLLSPKVGLKKPSEEA